MYKYMMGDKPLTEFYWGAPVYNYKVYSVDKVLTEYGYFCECEKVRFTLHYRNGKVKECITTLDLFGDICKDLHVYHKDFDITWDNILVIKKFIENYID